MPRPPRPRPTPPLASSAPDRKRETCNTCVDHFYTHHRPVQAQVMGGTGNRTAHTPQLHATPSQPVNPLTPTSSSSNAPNASEGVGAPLPPARETPPGPAREGWHAAQCAMAIDARQRISGSAPVVSAYLACSPDLAAGRRSSPRPIPPRCLPVPVPGQVQPRRPSAAPRRRGG